MQLLTQQNKQKINLAGWLCCLIFLFIFGAQCLTIAARTGQTVDETYYNGSGYPMVRYQNYRALGEHPPLIMQLASLPLLFFQPKFPIENMVYLPNSSEVDISKTGARFLYGMGNDPQRILFWERSVIVLLSLVLGAVLFYWAFQMYGLIGGLISIGLFCFSPDMIAHGSLFTTDMGVTVFFFLTMYALFCYFQRPSILRGTWVGIFCGLALLSKVSALILLPILITLLTFNFIFDPREVKKKSKYALPLFVLTVTILVFSLGGNRTIVGLMPLCLMMLSILFLEFNSQNKKINPVVKIVLLGAWLACLICSALAIKKGLLFPLIGIFWVLPTGLVSFYLLQNGIERPRLVFSVKVFCLIGLVAALVICLGYTDFYKTALRLKPFAHYVRTFSIAFSHSTAGHEVCAANSFVACDWRYFITALSVKVPFATLLLFFLGLISVFYLPLQKTERALILFPILIYLVVASLLNKINIGVRHVLPIYPFIFLVAGSVGGVISQVPKSAYRKIAFLILSICFIQLGMRNRTFFPDFISYVNEFISTPQKAARILADSNINWGQDNKRLVDYIKRNGISSVKISGTAMNADLYNYYEVNWEHMDGVDFKSPKAGFYAIDVALYLAEQHQLDSFFRQRVPYAEIGKTMYIFKVD